MLQKMVARLGYHALLLPIFKASDGRASVNGQENGNYYDGVIWGLGLRAWGLEGMENRMQTTTLHWGFLQRDY